MFYKSIGPQPFGNDRVSARITWAALLSPVTFPRWPPGGAQRSSPDCLPDLCNGTSNWEEIRHFICYKIFQCSLAELSYLSYLSSLQSRQSSLPCRTFLNIGIYSLHLSVKPGQPRASWASAPHPTGRIHQQNPSVLRLQKSPREATLWVWEC